VIYTSAVPPSNLEYMEAKRREIPLFSYPEMVGEVSRRYETVAIAGAHGKSTTTALTALIFARCGLDPTVLIGTKLRELGGRNFRAGKSRYLVLEADEYGRAFLNYSPAFLIVTNIDREHLDIYKNLMDIKQTFLKLFRQVLPGGALILNADDPNLTILQLDVERIAKRNHLHVYWYSHASRAAKKAKKALQIPGRHNVADATAAFTLATKIFKLPEDKVLTAIHRYRGSWRRYEYKGEYGFANKRYKIFDDYAHHPTEIQTTLAAFKEKFPWTSIVCVFQPHQAERLRRLFREFTGSFKDADALILLPAYHVAGREQVETRYTAQALTVAIAKKYPTKKVLYLDKPENISRELVYTTLRNAGLDYDKVVIVMMGAGTIVNYTSLLLS